MPSVSRLLGLMGPPASSCRRCWHRRRGGGASRLYFAAARRSPPLFLAAGTGGCLRCVPNGTPSFPARYLPGAWVLSPMSRDIVEGILLDRLEVAQSKEVEVAGMFTV